LREQRLLTDLQSMIELNQKSSLISVEYEGKLPDKYIVTYYCRSLIWVEGNKAPSISSRHQVEIYLHKDYPRMPPALKWLTNIFHPNILPPHKNGIVCISCWNPTEILDKLSIRIGEMLQYKNHNLIDPIDQEAAAWVRQNVDLLPLDTRSLF